MRNVKAAHAQEEEEGADLSLVLRTLAQHGLSEVRTVSLFTSLFYFFTPLDTRKILVQGKFSCQSIFVNSLQYTGTMYNVQRIVSWEE